MKTELTTGSMFSVNLQQGFILDENKSIIGAYSHHHKTVVMKVPNHSNYFNWTGTTFENYKFINSATDSFSIQGYTHEGDKELSDLIIDCNS